LKQWPLLAAKGLEKYPSDVKIASPALSIIKKAATTIDKRELMKADLCSALLRIIQADETNANVREKCQKILSEIVSP